MTSVEDHVFTGSDKKLDSMAASALMRVNARWLRSMLEFDIASSNPEVLNTLISISEQERLTEDVLSYYRGYRPSYIRMHAARLEQEADSIAVLI